MIDEIRTKIAAGLFEFAKHATEQSILRRISVQGLREAIDGGEIIEDYPNDKYGRDWLEHRRSCRLYCYHLPPETFECIDECAGYFVSREPVVPARVQVFDDPIAELLRRGVELRFVPNLWPLRDAVVASTLRFSLICMRNALPRVWPNNGRQRTRTQQASYHQSLVRAADAERWALKLS